MLLRIKKFLKQKLKWNYPMLHPIMRSYYKYRYGCFGLIFMLHRVEDIDESGIYSNERMKVSPEFLVRIITEYRDAGFDFLSLDEVYDIYKNGRRPKRNFLVFTMDDGYRDNYYKAFPVFEQQKVPFAVYVATDFPDMKANLWWYALEDYILNRKVLNLSTGEIIKCESKEEKEIAFLKLRSLILKFDSTNLLEEIRYLLSDDLHIDKYVRQFAMTWDEIKTMSLSPLCTIGAHTVTHPAFNSLSKDMIDIEVRRGCRRLSEKVGRKIEHFAYPYGSVYEVSDDLLSYCEKEFDFKTIVTTRQALLNRKGSAKRLPRFMLYQI